MHVGQHFSSRQTMTETLAQLFLVITGDRHPTLVDRRASDAAGLSWPPVPSTVPIALVSAVMARVAECIPEPGGVSYVYDIDLLSTLEVGQTVETVLTIEKIDEARFEVQLNAACMSDQGSKVAQGTTILKVL